MKRAGLILLIFTCAIACYWPALHGAILWDDPAHIPRAELQSWRGLARIWTETRATQQYYPVLFSAFWFEHKLWGDDTFGYHLVNVIWHAGSACLLALLLRRLWNSPAANRAGDGASVGWTVPEGTEWFAALLFTVHPIAVESVAWITEQKNTLSLLFYLAAANVYWKFHDTRRWPTYAVASGLFALALGSKTATVTLPAALLVVIWWKNGRLTKRDVLPLASWFVGALAMGLFTSWVERTFIGAEGIAFDLTFPQRLMLAGRVLWFYIGKLFWPAELNFFYPRWDVARDAMSWIVYVVATGASTIALWFLRRRSRAPLAAWLLFVGALFPILGFFKVFFFVFSYVNDHFVYLASLSFFASVSASLALALGRAPVALRRTAQAGCLVLVVVLALQTHRQSALYRDNETLFRATAAKNPESWMAHVLIGYALGSQPGRRAEAIEEYRTALRLNPDYPEAHVGLATELMKRPEDEAEALRHFEEALRLRPTYVEAHVNLAVALSKDPARLGEAVRHYEAALAIRPDFAETHNDLANALAKLPGRLPEALAHYEEALRLRPGYAEAHNNYALALAKMPGRDAAALEEFKAALRLNPNLAAAHHNLARFLAGRPGREAEMLEHAEAAVRLAPNSAEMRNTLAVIYAQRGQFDKARFEWIEALRLNPDYEIARRNLQRLTP
ncbi:MAG TPA: tetratricopeptide repeat protein [Opitutaceae bacterium]|nr:tetratricopeptide repeat protein [Opitutaceae bacterium]